MKVTSLSMKERCTGQFQLTLPDDGCQTIQVQEVDMCGWTLFECFLSSDTIIYMGLDNHSNKLEWIDMEDEHLSDYAISIGKALNEQLRLKRA